MLRLIKALIGVEPVDRNGNINGPDTTLAEGTEFQITIPKLRRPGDVFEEYWCEIQVAQQLYRVPLSVLQTANTAYANFPKW